MTTVMQNWVILRAFASLCVVFLGPDVVLGEGSPAAGPGFPQWNGKPFATNGTAERIYRPSIYLDILDGYWFFGFTNTNGSVPMRDPDPEMTFNKVAITSIIISRFLDGPLGPFDYVVFLVQSDLTYNNKTYGSAEITFSWASNAAYCGPDGLLVDRCEGGIFNWTQLGGTCETLRIYDPKKPDNLIVGFERLCKIPPYVYIPNTAYLIPRLSPLRLAGFAYFVPLLEGNTTHGKPVVVEHILGDLDLDVLASFALIDRVTGPRAPDFVGILVPIGVGFNSPSKARIGFTYMSPDQMSFPPFFPFNLFLS
eukprot:jgi/Botrbrau1/3495/Bobra.341_2s0025.1